MPLQICECGAKCRFPASALGRRGKCPGCGAVLTLTGAQQSDIIPIADDPLVSAAPSPAAFTAPSATELPSPARVNTSPPIIEAAASSRGYPASVLDAFLFASRLDNLITFLFLWICLAVAFSLLTILRFGIFGMLFSLLIHGWYAAYRFSIVGQAAGGNDDLPNIGGSRDDLGEYAASAVKWVGTWIVVMLPAGIYLAMRPTPFAGTAGSLSGGILNVFAQSADTTLFLVLLIAGLASWPLVILCVSLGGFGCLIHVDLLIRTVARSIGAYTSTVILVLATFGMDYVLQEALRNPSLFGGSMSGGQAILVSFLALGVTTYFDIVAMKLIGLYYHHFKDKFAWNWG